MDFGLIIFVSRLCYSCDLTRAIFDGHEVVDSEQGRLNLQSQ